MGRDEEVPEHFGLLHGSNLTRHRAIWTLATISAILGAFAALLFFGGGSAPDDKTIATLLTISGMRSVSVPTQLCRPYLMDC